MIQLYQISYTRLSRIVHQTWQYHHTPDMDVSYTSGVSDTFQRGAAASPVVLPDTQSRFQKGGVDISVSYTRHHYHTPDITVSYTRHHCIIHQTSLHHSKHASLASAAYRTPDVIVSYSRQCCIIHQTSLCQTPIIIVSYTKHRCIVHQASLYHTPDCPVTCLQQAVKNGCSNTLLIPILFGALDASNQRKV